MANKPIKRRLTPLTIKEMQINQNYNEVSPHNGQNSHHPQTINAGEGVEKREPCYTVGGM